MTNDLELTPSENGWMDILGTGLDGLALNIPSQVLKPTLKAIGRLVCTAAEVPSAYLESRADQFKDRAANRQKISTALAKHVIAKIPENPKLAERALDYFAGDIIRKKVNAEEVVRCAVEELTNTTIIQGARHEKELSADSLDDDWLNSFARYAENANSDDLRHHFGKILAGEIRRAGSYSLFSIDMLSKLGKSEAEIITSIAPYTAGGIILMTNTCKKLLTVRHQALLSALNILATPSVAGDGTCIDIKVGNAEFDNRPANHIIASRQVIFIVSSEKKTISYPAAMLTPMGEEILTLHTCDLDQYMLKEFALDMKQHELDVYVADLIKINADEARWDNERKIEVG